MGSGFPGDLFYPFLFDAVSFGEIWRWWGFKRAGTEGETGILLLAGLGGRALKQGL